MRRRTSGFTLLQLMVVLVILFILLALLMPAMMNARESARRTTCMTNFRSLTQGWVSYATDNSGQLVWANNVPGAWAEAGNTSQAIEKGTLYPYCKSVKSYQCPADPSGHYRSYSIMTQMNATDSSVARIYRTLSQLGDLTRTLVFIEEEDPRGYNMGSFVLPSSGDKWTDFPAHWHRDGMCISFADSHVEYMKFGDKRTLAITTYGVTTVNNRDLKRLQALVPPNQ